MTMEKIPVCDVGQRTNGVVLYYGYKAHSYEWPVVTAVSCTQDQCLSANYIMLTRAVKVRVRVRVRVRASCNKKHLYSLTERC